MMEDKRELIKPILFKLGVALTFSFAGSYLYRNHVTIRSFSLFRQSSKDEKVFGGGRSGLKGEFCGTKSSRIVARNEENPYKAVGANVGFSPNNKSTREEEEIIKLRNMIQTFQQRERNRKMKMLEYYGLKEQEAIIQELHNHLKINIMESTLKIDSLKAENQSLKAQASEYKRVVNEHEITMAKSKLLKIKMKSEAEQADQKLFDLQKKVMMFKDQERQLSLKDADAQEKQKMVKDFEDKLSELRMENSLLQLQKSELGRKLESTQILASILECPEDRVLEEAKQLRQVKHDLEQELDRLRLNHCSDVEELVYVKWVNACLRHELRNSPTHSGKTAATNLSKKQSPRSEQKVKELIHKYANSEIDENNIDLVGLNSRDCSSSQASVLTEAGEVDDNSTSNSSIKRTSSSNKQKMLKKLKKIFLLKPDNDRRGNKRIPTTDRTSMSSVTLRRTSASTGSLDDTATGSVNSDSFSSCISAEHAAANLHLPEVRFSHDPGILAMPRNETQIKNTNRQNRVHRSPSLSLDIQRLADLSIEELEEFTGYERRTNDFGSLHRYQTSVSRDGGSTDSPHHNHQLDQCHGASQKPELTKFAQALKSAHEKPRRL